MVNGLDHPTEKSTKLHTIPPANEPPSSGTPYALAAAGVNTSTVNNEQRPPSPNKSLTTAEENAVQVVRNHVESLKYPGMFTDCSFVLYHDVGSRKRAALLLSCLFLTYQEKQSQWRYCR